jgi:lysophospholipase L1-like esterase
VAPGYSLSSSRKNFLALRWSTLPLGVRVLVLAAGLFGALGSLEWWARDKNPQLPNWSGPGASAGLISGHPTRLWGMGPGVKRNANNSMATINALGFRGGKPETPKPSGRFRIMSLGDSAFYGFGVNDDDTFTEGLKDRFVAAGTDVDVVNAGVAGYSIVQHQLVMEEVGWGLEPDLLVLCNVWSDNTWDTFYDEDLIISARFARQNPLTRLALVKLFSAWWSGVSGSDEGRVIVWSASEGWPEGKVRRVPLARWISINDSLLTQAAERGVGAIFLKPTNTSLLDQSHVGPQPAWTPYFKAMDALAEHHGIPIVDVSALYVSSIEEGSEVTDLLWDKMHPTARGHTLVADALFGTLQAAGWPTDTLLPSRTPLPETGIEDVPNPEWSDDAGAGSHQLSLFEITRNQQVEIAEARKSLEKRSLLNPRVLGPGRSEGEEGPSPSGELPLGGSPTGLPPTPSPSGNGSSTGPDVQIGTWALAITLEGGEPPYAVQLIDDAGLVVGTAKLSAPRSFVLKVRKDVLSVVVRVTEGNDTASSASASIEQPQVSFQLGQ